MPRRVHFHGQFVRDDGGQLSRGQQRRAADASADGGRQVFAAASDSGAANGIGLAANSNYLYAAFSSSSTIATFAIQSGCVLAFVGDVFTIGLQGGLVGGMAGAGAWA